MSSVLFIVIYLAIILASISAVISERWVVLDNEVSVT
jgi:hypothetical protein